VKEIRLADTVPIPSIISRGYIKDYRSRKATARSPAVKHGKHRDTLHSPLNDVMQGSWEFRTRQFYKTEFVTINSITFLKWIMSQIGSLVEKRANSGVTNGRTCRLLCCFWFVVYMLFEAGLARKDAFVIGLVKARGSTEVMP
jgi:hypothetical protein